MKKYIHAASCIALSCTYFSIGCNADDGLDKINTQFAAVKQLEWNESKLKFYLIQKSMKKIDSLSSELNLTFTKIHAK